MVELLQISLSIIYLLVQIIAALEGRMAKGRIQRQIEILSRNAIVNHGRVRARPCRPNIGFAVEKYIHRTIGVIV